jgi:hypothetical protein
MSLPKKSIHCDGYARPFVSTTRKNAGTTASIIRTFTTATCGDFSSDAQEYAGNMTAVRFLMKIRKPVRRLVAGWTGVYQYTIDQVFEDVIVRCRQLNLRLAVSEEQAKQEFAVFLTVQAMNYVYTGGRRVAL